MPKKQSSKITLGYLGNLIGGKARAEKFSKEQTKHHLKKASLKRFGKK